MPVGGATSLLHRYGTLGLIATNTVAQGDTREVGLDAMVGDGFTITRAIKSKKWPSVSANLEYAAVWGTLSHVDDVVPKIVDDERVAKVSTMLEAAGRIDGIPERLAENTGLAFIGCYVLGMGFTMEPELAQEWIAADHRNADVLFPYLNGEDLNSRPDASASRWVIDFGARTETEASLYELPMERIRQLIKPERLQNNRKVYRDYWWQYAEKRPALRQAIADLSEVLVIARVSKTVMPMRVQTRQVMSEACVVFATDDYGDQAVLSSSLHQLWAITYGSTLETRIRYTPSDVFETLPRPKTTERLESIGHLLERERQQIMLRRRLGLTKLYNLVNNPDVTTGSDRDIALLRDIHVEVDNAVICAFGWDDIALKHGFYSYRSAERWSITTSARIELLGRVLTENHRRAATSGEIPSYVESLVRTTDDHGITHVV